MEISINIDFDTSVISDAFKEIQQEIKNISSNFEALQGSIDLITESLSNSNEGFNNTINIISTAVGFFSALVTAIDAGIIALGMLDAALISTGIGLFVVLLGTLVGAFMSSTTETEKQKTKFEELSESVEELSKDYEGLKEKQAAALQETSAESDYVSDLWGELQTLSEKRNKSNEETERAKWLAKELNETLGENIKLTKDGSIANQDQIKSINKLLEKKRALAVIEALEPGYKQAIIEKGKAQAEMQDILTQKLQKQQEIQEIMNDPAMGSVLKGMNVKILQNEIDELDGLYSKSEEVYNGHLNTMNQYEELSIAASNKNYDVVNNLIDTMNNGIKTSARATEGELDEQYRNILGSMKRTNESGAELTETQQMQLKENLLRSSEELLASMEKSGTISADKRNEISKNTLSEILRSGEMTKDEFEKICERLGISTQEGLALVGGTIDSNGKILISKMDDTGKNCPNGYITSFTTATEENQPQLVAAVNQNVNTQRETLGLNDKVSKLGKMANETADDFNTNISKNVPETEKAMGKMSQKVTGAFNGKKLPKLKGKFYDEKISSALGKIAGLFGFASTPRMNIIKAANGALLELGQFFLAREAGLELVGTIGSKTAVMNNNQIVDAVSNGVYRAVTAAMGGGGGNYTFHITNAQVTCAKKYQLYPLANPS